MCDFKPGDEVVCVAGGAKSFDGLGFVTLVVGTTYTISATARPGDETRLGRIAGEETLVQVAELGHLETTTAWGFRASRFRKVQRRDLSAWLKTSVPSTDHLDKPLPAKKRERVE